MYVPPQKVASKILEPYDVSKIFRKNGVLRSAQIVAQNHNFGLVGCTLKVSVRDLGDLDFSRMALSVSLVYTMKLPKK